MPTTYNEPSQEAILLNNDYTFVKGFIQNLKNALTNLYNRGLINQSRTTNLYFTNSKVRGMKAHKEVLYYLANKILVNDDIDRMFKLQRQYSLLVCSKIDVFSIFNLETIKKIVKYKLKITLAKDEQMKRVIHVECEECPVCLDEKNDMFKGFFKCSHSMCKECFDIMPNKICPLCRSEV